MNNFEDHRNIADGICEMDIVLYPQEESLRDVATTIDSRPIHELWIVLEVV
jgi:hypothetical protein